MSKPQKFLQIVGLLIVIFCWASTSYAQMDVCLEAIPASEASAETYFRRGEACLEARDYLKAVLAFDRVVEFEPDNAEAYFYLGVANYRMRRFPQGIEGFLAAIQIDDEYTDAYFYRGLSYMQLGHPDTALPDFDRVIELSPTFAEAYLHRGDEQHNKIE